jgi:hypothetical protein
LARSAIAASSTGVIARADSTSWNTVYLQREVQALADGGLAIDEPLLRHLSPLGWEHINLTGDYVWRQNKRAQTGAFRPLRRDCDGSAR